MNLGDSTQKTRSDVPADEALARQERSRLTVAVSGAGGLIGGPLCSLLAAGGHSVLRLVRRPRTAPDEAQWDPARGIVDLDRLSGVSAAVHLAGENTAGGRWTRRRKEAIRSSRVDATRALVSSLSRLEHRPATFVCASAVGIYGDRNDEVLTETSPPGRGFLAQVCQDWEREAQVAASHGLRCVNLRFGVVLTPAGGMLGRLLPLFRWGLGGPVGRGDQYVSWVALDDALGAIQHALLDERVCGPVNVVAPQAVTSREFAQTLGRVLHRPAYFRVPAIATRAAFGQLADELILASTRATPEVLLRTGYSFHQPALEDALRHLLGRER